jgi:hypothetical protein
MPQLIRRISKCPFSRGGENDPSSHRPIRFPASRKADAIAALVADRFGEGE